MSTISLSSRLSVYIDSDVHPIYERYTSRSKSTQKAEDFPFETMKDLFIVAACFGAKYDKFLEIQKSKEIFDSSLFSSKIEVPILLSLAYHKTKDLETLSDGRTVLDIVQGWANGGIRIIENQLIDTHVRPIFNLTEFLFQELEDISDSFGVQQKLRNGFTQERDFELTQGKSSRSFNTSDCENLLTILEIELRCFIVEHLEKLSNRWWKQRVPEEIRQRAEKRKVDREQDHPGMGKQDLPMSDYLDFADLKIIITQKNNWEEVFKNIFRRADIIQVKLDEIAPFRNDIAHHRTIPANDIDIFVSDARQILRIIREPIINN